MSVVWKCEFVFQLRFEITFPRYIFSSILSVVLLMIHVRMMMIHLMEMSHKDPKKYRISCNLV